MPHDTTHLDADDPAELARHHDQLVDFYRRRALCLAPGYDRHIAERRQGRHERFARHYRALADRCWRFQ